VIRLVEICKQNLEPYHRNDITAAVRYGHKFGLRDVAINPEFIVALYPHDMSQQIEQGLMPDDLDDRHEFTRVVMNNSSAGGFSLIVVESLIGLMARMPAHSGPYEH
jgi:hypothetical protein